MIALSKIYKRVGFASWSGRNIWEGLHKWFFTGDGSLLGNKLYLTKDFAVILWIGNRKREAAESIPWSVFVDKVLYFVEE